MLAGWIVGLAAIWLAIGMWVFGRRKPGYSHVAHTISELGETGARDQRAVALGLFLPVGLLTLVSGSLLQAVSLATAALAGCIAVGYLGAAAFPCDRGSPLSGTPQQAFHNLAGAVQYVGGGFALMVLAESRGQPFRAAGFVVLGSAIALSVVPPRAGRGLIQRLAELCLFGCLLLAVQS